jgi:hypothetical protein
VPTYEPSHILACLETDSGAEEVTHLQSDLPPPSMYSAVRNVVE